MEHDVNELFEDFRTQVNEIANHAGQVSKLKFSAQLKNGTSFRFHYDADTFGKEKKLYKPLSAYNAIIDIIGSAVTIAMMVMHISNLFWVLACIFAFTFFIANAVMHLFDEERIRTITILFHLSCAIKIVFLCLFNFTFAPGVQSVVITTLGIGALSLLLLSIQTKGAVRASSITLATLPFMNLLGGISSLFLPGSDLVFALWALGPAAFGGKMKVRSNSIFAIIGIMLAGWLF